MQAHNYITWRVDKARGNHLTSWWLYSRLRSWAPSSSVVVYGVTDFDGVNPTPHAYCRGKAAYIEEGFALLCAFVEYTDNLISPSLPPPAPLATPLPAFIPPPPPSLHVLADWDPLTWVENSDDYLHLVRSERLIPLSSPVGVDPEGWSYAYQHRTGKEGYYPPDYASEQ